MRLTSEIKKEIINKIIDDIPQHDFRQQAHDLMKKEYEKLIPKEIKELIKTNPERFSKEYRGYDAPGCWEGVQVCVIGHSREEDKLSASVLAQIHELLKQNEDQRQMLNKVHNELSTAFAGISTLKKAIEIFPEFEKYFPIPEDSPKYLPVHTNVVVSLMDAGWPKNKPNKPKRATA